MPTLFLLTKATGIHQLKQIQDVLKSELENLDVTFDLKEKTFGKWVQLSFSGEDQVIATNLVKKEIGVCPVTLETAKDSVELKGFITKIDEINQRIILDIGIFDPKVTYAAIPLVHLQRALFQGKKVALKDVSQVYALRENVPLNVAITSFEPDDEGFLEADLSFAQTQKLLYWKDSLLDRLLVLGASKNEVSSAIEHSRLNRDIIDIESLGLFEFSLTCKLGTEAVGVIPQVGWYLKRSSFLVFNPRRIFKLIGESSLDL